MKRDLPALWLCADLAIADGDALVTHVARALAVTPALVWLRSPRGTPARALADVARKLLAVTNAAGGLLLVGDRVDVALVTGADGVHLPEHALQPHDAREFARGRELIVSVAVHDRAGVIAARDHADALVISPFGEVAGKGAALGEAGFRALRDAAGECFTVALGGITTREDSTRARRAGADAVAARRALYEDGGVGRLCAAPAQPSSQTVTKSART